MIHVFLIESMSPVHVIISGASSVGKSTLLDECLKKYHRYKRIQEVARTVLNRLKLNGKNLSRYIEQVNVNAFVGVQQKIIDEQVSSFEKEKENNYFSDRSGFDALAYVHYYFNNEQRAETLFQSGSFQQ